MKKYLIVPTPLIFCTILSILYSSINPKEFEAPNLAKEGLNFLSTTWFVIGAVFSALILIVLLVYDLFAWWDNLEKRRMLRRYENKKPKGQT
jgi:hypothetical protein